MWKSKVLKPLLLVVALLMMVDSKSASAIDAPNAILALWFPVLGADLSGYPSNSVERAIWLIQRGEFTQAETILKQLQDRNKLGPTGMRVWQFMDRVRDTSPDVVPEHIADSFLKSEPQLRFGEAIIREGDALPIQERIGEDSTANALEFAFSTCLGFSLVKERRRIDNVLMGTPAKDNVLEVGACTNARNRAQANLIQYLPGFAPSFDAIIDAALIPIEEISARAQAYEALAREANSRNDYCAAGYFLMQQGDVIAVPSASPLMLGMRRDWAGHLDGLPQNRELVAKIWPKDIESARQTYQEAAARFKQCRQGMFSHLIDIRMAYLAYRGDNKAANNQWQTASTEAQQRGDTRVARIAKAIAGVLSGSHESVRTAIHGSIDAGDFGAAMAIQHVTQLYSERLRERDEPDLAVKHLTDTADDFRDARLPGAAMQLYSDASKIFHSHGRTESELYFLTEAMKSAVELSACHSAVIQAGDCKGISNSVLNSMIGTSIAELAFGRENAFITASTREPRQGPWERLLNKSRTDSARAAKALTMEKTDLDLLEANGGSDKDFLDRQRDSLTKETIWVEFLRQALAIASLASQTSKSCQEKVDAQEKVRQLTDDPQNRPYMIAFRAIARCDARIVQELREQLRQTDPIALLMGVREAHSQESPVEHNNRQKSAVQQFTILTRAALLLKEFDLLSRWLAQVSAIPKSFAEYSWLSFEQSWLSARIEVNLRQHTNARTRLEALLRHPYLDQNPTGSLDIHSALVSNEVVSGNSTKALADYLHWQYETTRQRELLTGAIPSTPESAELIQLLRKASVSETISPGEEARIRSLIPRVPLRDSKQSALPAPALVPASVPAGDSIVVYYMNRMLAAAWVLELGQPIKMVKLTDDVDTLIEHINAYTASIVVGSSSELERNRTRLYADLVEPLGTLRGNRVAVAPALMMEQIPFAELIGRGISRGADYEKAVVLLPRLFRSPTKVTTSPDEKALIIGVNGAGLTDAIDEAKEVAKILDVNATVGPNATLETIRGQVTAAPIIHFATHATLDAANPFASRIELNDPGAPLPGWWLFSQPISARLVTLSACQTAEGSVGKGELFPSGLYSSPSFAETFHIAGAKFVVGSLWDAEDSRAKLLMTRFYSELNSATRDPVVALTNVKRNLIKEGLATPAQLAVFQISARSLEELMEGK